MNREFIEAIEEIERDKGINKDILFEAIEAALISAYKRNFDSDKNVRVHMERETGDVRVYHQKQVVEEVENPKEQISLEEARKISPGYEVDDLVEEEVTPKNFGRIAAQTAKQVVIQRIREAERELIYEEYVDKQDDIINGIVQRIEQKNVIIDLGKVEAILPPQEQMDTDEYNQGDRIKAYVVEVKKTTKEPQIILSRTHPGLIKRLLELEVPEIYDGTVEIKGIAREAGYRSKVAVYSRHEEVDPVGSCVGNKGSRIQSIVDELKGENIDVITWSSDPVVFISNSLSPSKVLEVKVLDEQDQKARVVVPDHQLSLAIGKEGQNARLAAKLTNWKIDILSESQLAEKGESSVEVEDFVEESASPEEPDNHGDETKDGDEG
ncbi:transcription termination factor NusA [Natranaerobius thermophilus]|uniref:Transcription termination/antitermination protein NusA n=1 Tax=Natranaerobius thermophilus (strain ATCC BAA-1301 / DSM 18059 / JW/NM-WN-LF) TaxID=457570 RepID=B2A394_NATTJ|nr:transcription termination factor NusA [Natranaerobius thermophilus]ACB85024.1 NusA antitermination factor [Natranaerobius thermophilus JW/NM-WN-LF]